MKLSNIVVPLLFALVFVTVESNSEGDALNAWKSVLSDPNNVLQSWDPTLVNPCTWFHVTCNSDNSVTRIDLGNAGLSGPFVPELAVLINLQYLQVENNKISGVIPMEFGNLTNLVSLGVSHNLLQGTIPSSLANLTYLRFMYLNSNKLTGRLPSTLVLSGNLKIMNVSDNLLAGTRRRTRKTGYRITTIIQDPKA